MDVGGITGDEDTPHAQLRHVPIDEPGAGEIQHRKRLMLSRPFFERIPDQSVIAGENGTRYDYVITTRGKGYLFAYTYTGRIFQIQMGAISGKQVRTWWYDPRTGKARQIGTFRNTGVRAFTPPGAPAAGNDWVLVLTTRTSASPLPALNEPTICPLKIDRDHLVIEHRRYGENQPLAALRYGNVPAADQ
jgi:hypothetical protein